MSSRRVLIVEDEMIVQLHLARIVAELGHELVGTAVNTREALELAQREAPELVLMDIHLADGDDGVDTAQKLVRSYDCAIVFVTAYADQKTIERTELVGAAGYLVKPFTAPAVRAAISTAMSTHQRLVRVRGEARALSSIVDSLGDALLLIDAAGKITFTNPRAADLTGCAANEADGRELFEVVRVPVESERRSHHSGDDAAAVALEVGVRRRLEVAQVEEVAWSRHHLGGAVAPSERGAHFAAA